MKSKYLILQELVSPAIYSRFLEQGWKFVDTHIIEYLDDLREYIERPLTINNYHVGGKNTNNGVIGMYDKSLDSFYNNRLIPFSQQVYGREVIVNVNNMHIDVLFEKASLLMKKHDGITIGKTVDNQSIKIEFVNK